MIKCVTTTLASIAAVSHGCFQASVAALKEYAGLDVSRIFVISSKTVSLESRIVSQTASNASVKLSRELISPNSVVHYSNATAINSIAVIRKKAAETCLSVLENAHVARTAKI